MIELHIYVTQVSIKAYQQGHRYPLTKTYHSNRKFFSFMIESRSSPDPNVFKNIANVSPEPLTAIDVKGLPTLLDGRGGTVYGFFV